jgi:hypothetical protein
MVERKQESLRMKIAPGDTLNTLERRLFLALRDQEIIKLTAEHGDATNTLNTLVLKFQEKKRVEIVLRATVTTGNKLHIHIKRTNKFENEVRSYMKKQQGKKATSEQSTNVLPTTASKKKKRRKKKTVTNQPAPLPNNNTDQTLRKDQKHSTKTVPTSGHSSTKSQRSNATANTFRPRWKLFRNYTSYTASIGKKPNIDINVEFINHLKEYPIPRYLYELVQQAKITYTLNKYIKQVLAEKIPHEPAVAIDKVTTIQTYSNLFHLLQVV